MLAPDDIAPDLCAPFAEFLLALADDKLIVGHRNSDWTGLAPILEEDIAFSSLAQDEMAHAQALYEIAGPLLARTADELAFGRSRDEYRCAQLVELPDEFDWATALARQFFCDHADRLRLQALTTSSYKPLASLAARLVREEQVHVEHVDGWFRRLGTGTDEAHGRLQSAVDHLAPLASQLFEPVERQDALRDAGLTAVDPFELHARWSDALQAVARDARVSLVIGSLDLSQRGGRRGVHSEHLASLLDEMCEVWRLEPGAAW